MTRKTEEITFCIVELFLALSPPLFSSLFVTYFPLHHPMRNPLNSTIRVFALLSLAGRIWRGPRYIRGAGSERGVAGPDFLSSE